MSIYEKLFLVLAVLIATASAIFVIVRLEDIDGRCKSDGGVVVKTLDGWWCLKNGGKA